MLARLSIFNVFYFLFLLLPLLLWVPFINNEVWIFSLISGGYTEVCKYLHPIIIVEFELNWIVQLNFWSQFWYRRFPIPHLSFMVISTYFHFLQMHLSKKMIFHLEMVILRKNMKILDTIQKFLCQLGMKTEMHLLEIIIFHYIVSSSDLPKLRTSSKIAKVSFLKCVIF